MKGKESYCILCGKEKDGIEVKEDYVIDALRWFNRTVLKKPPRNNRIVVCASCYPKYKIQRKKYIGRQRLYLALGILFLLFGVIVSLNKLFAVLIGIGLCILLYLFSLLSYMPELEIDEKEEKAKRKA